MARRLSIFLVTFLITGISVAQTIYYQKGKSWRGYTGTVTAPICSLKLCNRYPMVSWDSYFEEFAAWKGTDPEAATSFMNFRVMFPPGYNINDNTKKYPIILMLHGAGESGRIWTGRYVYAPTDPRYDNNSHNLLHGGDEHRLAVLKPATDPRSFPGILVFPQASYSGSWGDATTQVLSENEEFVVRFLEEQIVPIYHGDIDRIYMHGLSNGAKGTWTLAQKRPDLFAAIHPMSGVPLDNDQASDILVTTPIRLSQGGTDTNPSPGAAYSIIDALTAKGGTPQLFYYPTLGHGTWVTTYNEPDFFSWLLSKNKRQIYIFGGSSELCTNATKKLGFSAGFAAYRWKKDGVIINGETTRYLTITGTGNYTGTYTIEFQRTNDPTWYSSLPVNITAPSGGGITPVLAVTGSLILPYTDELGANIGSIGQTETRLVAPSGYPSYEWYKNGIKEGPTTTANNVLIALGGGSGGSSAFNGKGNQANAGNWTVRLTENSGCISNFSNVKSLVYNTASVAPCSPCHTSPPTGGVTSNYFTGISQPIITTLALNKMLVSWTDNCPDEEYFEIWRYRRSNTNDTSRIYPTQDWQMIDQVPSNTTSYTDIKNLRPYGQYRYAVRAVTGNQGRFSNLSTTNPWARNLEEYESPTAPGDLAIVTITETSIGISWSPARDNDVIHRYEVFNGSTLVASLTNDISGDQTDGNPAPPTTYTFTGLDPGTTYLLNVRAKDFRGNYSPFPQALVATTSNPTNGLNYKYYITTGLSGNNTSNANQLTEPYTATNGPNFNFSTATPNQIGVTTTFNVAMANTIQNTSDPNNFVVALDGFIEINTPGTYTFWTRSDDGSRLYITTTAPMIANSSSLIVNNDGAHGEINKSGLFNFPNAGKYPIRVTFFENGGGQALTVKYRAGNFHSTNQATIDANYNNVNAVIIPANKLFLSGTTFTNYYSNATGNLDLVGSWGSNVDGSGTAPTNFTTNYQFFTIANRSSATLTSPWTISGASSRLIVGDNVTLTLNEALTAKLYANTGSVINLNHTTVPQLVQLHANSTVNLNVAGNVPQAVYGNLNLKTGATTKTLALSSTIVNGNLSVDDQVTLKGIASPNQSIITVAGNLTFNGTSGTAPVASERYSLLMKGSQPHTIFSNQLNLGFAGLEVDFGSILNFNFNDSNPHAVTIGVANGSGSLLLRTGSSLQLGQHSLIVNGASGINTTDDSGTISISGGDITVSTTSGQTSNIFFADSGHSIRNLTLANTGLGQVNLLGTSTLTGLMTLSSGTVNMQGDFIVKSDASGTARIGTIGTGGKINGNIRAQRYMDGEGRIYRYIASPVKNATVAQLQAYFPVTGNFTGTTVIPGVTSGASMFRYNEPNYIQFPSVGGTNQETLQKGVGYTAYIREDVNSTVWEVTGEPNQGDVTFALTGNTTNDSNKGWNLLGNPYPSAIQWAPGSNWTGIGTGVNSVARIRENSNGTTAVRTYGTNWDGVIAPGQAFWVQTTSASPTLIVKETAKTTDGQFFRIGDQEDKVRVTMRSATLEDVAAIRFDDVATAAYDLSIDGIKLDNTFFNISTLTSDNKPMALNNTTPNYCEQEIKLRITNAAEGAYSLDITGVGSLLSKDEVIFTDSFTQTQQPVADEASYSFSITADPASKADGRFTLRFKKPEVVLNQTLKTDAACEQSSPIIKVNNTQPGVTYQAYHNGIAISEGLTSTGGTLELAVNPALVAFGSTTATIKAGFKGCNNFELPMTIAVQRDTLPVPEIMMEPLKLIASTENANYTWYFNGEELKGQTSQELLAPEDGQYVVEVTRASCIKKSDTVDYAAGRITGIEKSNLLQQLYPNPTRDKVVITIEQPIDFPSIRVITTLGQLLQIQATRISNESAEVDFTQLPTGLYLLQINGQRYRVLKE